MTLYFIAVIPPEPVYSDVYALKQEIADKYGSRRSLRNPPHITLLPPATGNIDWENQITKVLDDFRINCSSFQLKLEGFASFPNRRRKNPVIYVHNEESQELKKLYLNLIEELSIKNVIGKDRHPQKFTPHMTIGYRDLTLEQYDRAWAEFSERKYASTFIVNSVSLLKHDKGEGKWTVLKEFPFGP